MIFSSMNVSVASETSTITHRCRDKKHFDDINYVALYL